LGRFDDYDTRQAAYWAVFGGAFGHTYGCHPVWQLLGERYAPITFARRHWQQALGLPGACQMRHLRNLIESRPMLSRVPDQSLLLEEKSGAEHRRACRGEGYCFIYLPQGGALELNLGPLQETHLCAWWYDPRTGDAQNIGVLPHKKRLELTAPWTGPCSDWVLVIDSAEKSFPAPGKTQP
jgi:hypothetical protein